MEMFLFFALMAVIGISALLLNYLYEKKRTEAWANKAQQLGFSFFENNSDLLREFKFDFFRKGHSREIKNLLRQNNAGVDLSICDFIYETKGSKNNSSHKQTVCVISTLALNLPEFELHPRRFLLDTVFSMISGSSVDFESDPEFNGKYSVSANNHDAVKNIFGAEPRNWLTNNFNADFSFEAKDNALLVICKKRIKPEQVEPLMRRAFDVMNLFA